MGDNDSVATGCSIPSGNLKKNQHDIAQHWVMEALAAGVVNLEHIPGKYNLADLLAKTLGPYQYYTIIKEFLF